MTRVVLDAGRCRAYGLCVTAHPEIFTLSAGSPVAVLTRDVIGPDDTDDVQEAIRACPAQAISLAED